MTEWLPVVILTAVQIILRLVNVAGMIWREHVHARANCVQMRTASSSHVVLCELQPDGAMLLVVPQREASRGEAEVTATGRSPEERAGV